MGAPRVPLTMDDVFLFDGVHQGSPLGTFSRKPCTVGTFSFWGPQTLCCRHFQLLGPKKTLYCRYFQPPGHPKSCTVSMFRVRQRGRAPGTEKKQFC